MIDTRILLMALVVAKGLSMDRLASTMLEAPGPWTVESGSRQYTLKTRDQLIQDEKG